MLKLSFAGLLLSIVPFAFWQACKKQPVHLEYAYPLTLVVHWVYGLSIEVCIRFLRYYTRLKRLRSTFAG